MKKTDIIKAIRGMLDRIEVHKVPDSNVDRAVNEIRGHIDLVSDNPSDRDIERLAYAIAMDLREARVQRNDEPLFILVQDLRSFSKKLRAAAQSSLARNKLADRLERALHSIPKERKRFIADKWPHPHRYKMHLIMHKFFQPDYDSIAVDAQDPRQERWKMRYEALDRFKTLISTDVEAIEKVVLPMVSELRTELDVIIQTSAYSNQMKLRKERRKEALRAEIGKLEAEIGKLNTELNECRSRVTD